MSQATKVVLLTVLASAVLAGGLVVQLAA